MPISPARARILGMVRSTSLVALAGLACTFAAGCGDDSKSDAAKPQPAKANLEQFLMQAGEEPGFDPIESARVDSGVESLGLTAAGTARLRRNGFISITYQPIAADDGNAGVTNVHLFKTEAGAQDWLEYETSDVGIHSHVPETKIRRFTVQSVPGARGWTGRDLHGNPIGHVFWIQGRCMLVLGNEGEGSFVELLSTGAKAIYARTNGECPA
jgi:hypothetical protein